ncbi:MAG: Gfo/Idh/MocA family oxidoreductase, partial [Planctomycetota bacterium]|nr:Gfo/Idh/MocA family oxidoreductase [Planctomycetota bacterium]
MSNMIESHLANGSFGRRTFIKSAAAAGVILVGWKPTLGRGGVLQKTNVASVGVGGMGASDLGEISAHPEVAMVALCDVDRNNLKSAADKHQGAKTFVDFREMFDSMGDQIDAVSVTTPDHMHAIIAMMALNQNKHVYCQKPLAHSVHECRALRNTAMAKPELATQMGTQNASRVMKQRCMQGLRDEICGQIKEIHAWTDRPNGWWPQGNPRTPGSNPVPSQLEWDLWLGTAPARPYIDK